MTNCSHCGLPPDLCKCAKHNGELVTFEEHRKLHGLGIMPPIRPRKCLKCGKEGLYSREVEERLCPCCGVVSKFHIGCGGRVVEYDIFERTY